MRKERGITLIALVITIIILLILAVVAISSLTENGLFEKAKLAKGKQENAEGIENTTLKEYENEIGKYLVSSNRDDEDNINYKECTIEISERGIITVKDVENLYAFLVVKDGKCLDISIESTYKLIIPVNQAASIYVIAADENANLYKSNIVSYTATSLDLFNEGRDNELVTGGWKALMQDKNNSQYSVLTDSLYMKTTTSANCLSAITTNNLIDITQYNYLCCEIIHVSNTNPYYPAIFGISNSNESYYPSLEKYITPETNSSKKTYRLDITDISGEYYPTITGTMNIYIYKMWLE